MCENVQRDARFQEHGGLRQHELVLRRCEEAAGGLRPGEAHGGGARGEGRHDAQRGGGRGGGLWVPQVGPECGGRAGAWRPGSQWPLGGREASGPLGGRGSETQATVPGGCELPGAQRSEGWE